MGAGVCIVVGTHVVDCVCAILVCVVAVCCAVVSAGETGWVPAEGGAELA